MGMAAIYLTGKYNTLVRARQRCLAAWLSLSGALLPPKITGKPTTAPQLGAPDRRQLHHAAAGFGNRQSAEIFAQALVACSSQEVGELLRSYNDAARFHNAIRSRAFYYVTAVLCGLRALPVVRSKSVP